MTLVPARRRGKIKRRNPSFVAESSQVMQQEALTREQVLRNNKKDSDEAS